MGGESNSIRHQAYHAGMTDRPEHVTVPIRVRYVECDPMNVVHHSVYPVWLEMGRTELLRAQGANYAECEKNGIFFAVARLNIRYKKPAHYDEQLELLCIGMPCAGVKVDHRYELRCGDALLMTAETTLVCVTAEGKAVPVPKDLLP